MDTRGFTFHDVVDIVANDVNGANSSLVRCVHSGWLFLLNYGQYDKFPINWLPYDEDRDEPYDTMQVWILLDTGETTRCEENTFDVYGHVVPSAGIFEKWGRNIDAIESFFALRRVEEGEIIGHMSKPGDNGYGSNAAEHVHFARFEGERVGLCDRDLWQNKILANPLRLLENGVSQDTTDPMFLNFSETEPDLGYPIDLVDDSENFGTPYAMWYRYRDSEGDPEYHHDNIIKYRCPWLITDIHSADLVKVIF